MYSVSVIMPVYNNEKDLKNAIDSILNQKMPGFELILVNDGSTDQSGQICDAYAKQEPLLIRVIHQTHQGLSAALNRGLFKSSGEYIYFADVHDQFHPKLLQSNVKLAHEKEVDLVVFGFSQTSTIGLKENENHLPRMPLITAKDEFRNHFRNFYHFYPHGLFNKLYRKEYLFHHRLRFPNQPLQDAFFNLSVYNNLNSVAFNRDVFCYRDPGNVSVTPFHENYFETHLRFIDQLTQLFIDWGYLEEYNDLLAEEVFKSLMNEMKNITAPESPYTFQEQVERMDAILSIRKIRDSLNQIDLSLEMNPFERRLLTYFKKGKSEDALELKSKRRDTIVTTDRLKHFMKRIFPIS